MGTSDNGTVQHVTLARAPMNHEPPSSALLPLARFFATSRQEKTDEEAFFNARDISFLLHRMPPASRSLRTATHHLAIFRGVATSKTSSLWVKDHPNLNTPPTAILRVVVVVVGRKVGGVVRGRASELSSGDRHTPSCPGRSLAKATRACPHPYLQGPDIRPILSLRQFFSICQFRTPRPGLGRSLNASGGVFWGVFALDDPRSLVQNRKRRSPWPVRLRR
ncbi:hypothetical protein CKAH01_03657 [Colletotrichum kahawae]|uniref:Uncharacterized protein n=1 Tax=Colletotrichum kahawae TaxID=34407 RepID=A0AAD9YS90_COLKA|nr:hypothetical protein CKAH01_03657 [Colletotrichum kahawae]